MSLPEGIKVQSQVCMQSFCLHKMLHIRHILNAMCKIISVHTFVLLYFCMEMMMYTQPEVMEDG